MDFTAKNLRWDLVVVWKTFSGVNERSPLINTNSTHQKDKWRPSKPHVIRQRNFYPAPARKRPLKLPFDTSGSLLLLMQVSYIEPATTKSCSKEAETEVGTCFDINTWKRTGTHVTFLLKSVCWYEYFSVSVCGTLACRNVNMGRCRFTNVIIASSTIFGHYLFTCRSCVLFDVISKWNLLDWELLHLSGVILFSIVSFLLIYLQIIWIVLMGVLLVSVHKRLSY